MRRSGLDLLCKWGDLVGLFVQHWWLGIERERVARKYSGTCVFAFASEQRAGICKQACPPNPKAHFFYVKEKRRITSMPNLRPTNANEQSLLPIF